MDVALDRGWDGNGGKVVKVWGDRQQERKLATPLPLNFGLKGNLHFLRSSNLLIASIYQRW